MTDNHPFWSVDRQEFVDAGELAVGETLDLLDGTTKITSISERGPPEPVYNLEVHGEHVYRVSTLGVLVHNCYSKKYPRDFQSGNTAQRNAHFKSEGEARALARTKLGAKPVKVGTNKLRSQDGRCQYRAKTIDTTQNHVHLDRLDAKTGEVLENWHLNYPQGGRR